MQEFFRRLEDRSGGVKDQQEIFDNTLKKMWQHAYDKLRGLEKLTSLEDFFPDTYGGVFQNRYLGKSDLLDDLGSAAGYANVFVGIKRPEGLGKLAYLDGPIKKILIAIERYSGDEEKTGSEYYFLNPDDVPNTYFVTDVSPWRRLVWLEDTDRLKLMQEVVDKLLG